MFYMKRILTNAKAIVAAEPKTKPLIISAKTAKSVEKKTIISAPKIKPTTKIKSVDLAEKSRVKTQILAPSVSLKKTKSVKTKSVEPQPIVSVKKVKAESVELKSAKKKVEKPELAKAIKTKPQAIISTSPRAKIELPENKIKPKNAKLADKIQPTPLVKVIENKVARKPKKKKAKPIGSAIFRGKKERYGFEIFPIDAELEDVSAIYVISKRKTDKLKKGHHALVCIGQTESVLGEIKRHKKGKCVKKYQANVISILPEENEKKRLRIETDLKAAHTVMCHLE